MIITPGDKNLFRSKEKDMIMLILKDNVCYGQAVRCSDRRPHTHVRLVRRVGQTDFLFALFLQFPLLKLIM